MEIKKLRIKNFRSYKGLTEFDFNIDGEKNIILIGGENGAGKSSIFEAIKLCIYGPLNYGYQGMVPIYISNIKSMINEDAYGDEELESFISMDIKLNIDGEENIYSLERRWTFDSQRLVEEFIVGRDGLVLGEDEKLNFTNYFKTIIPPNVFDLFFFDGEKLLDFFGGGESNRVLKEAILELNNFDIFNILDREIELNTRRRDREKKELEGDIKELERLENSFEEKRQDYGENLENISSLKEKIKLLEIDIENENKEFIRAGGLNKSEREMVLSTIAVLEEERKKINQDIKDYSNNYLAFNILDRQVEKLEKRIGKEDDYNRYKIIEEQFSNESLEKLVRENISDMDKVDKFIEDMKNTIVPDRFDDSFRPIHQLSLEQRKKILLQIDDIKRLDIGEINFFERLDEIKEEIREARERLRQALSENEEKEFIDKINKLNESLNKKIKELEKLENLSVDLEARLDRLSRELEKVNEKINIVKRADSVKDINENINKMTDYLLKKITNKKKREVEKDFITMFSKIIRKDKYIDYIFIDDDFDICLYKKKSYREEELASILENIGRDEMEKKMGRKFVEELEEVERDRSLSKDRIALSTKIDAMKLSSGEKQIYILCLYWSLIKSADLSIPFIIDTPYGRIDKMHRYSITREFFPNISHQVIIFSTNTEVYGDLYKELERNIAGAYTLDYIMDSRSTEVSSGYFEEMI